MIMEYKTRDLSYRKFQIEYKVNIVTNEGSFIRHKKIKFVHYKSSYESIQHPCKGYGKIIRQLSLQYGKKMNTIGINVNKNFLLKEFDTEINIVTEFKVPLSIKELRFMKINKFKTSLFF